MRHILLFLLLASAAFTQVWTGSFYGRVLDQSGGALDHTLVTVVSESTGFSWHTQTDDRGEYRLTSLPPSAYSVSATRHGFKTITQTHAHLEVAQDLQVNLTLTIGDSSESVTVAANNSLLEEQDSTAGYLLPAAIADALPLDERNILGLVTLGPGAIPRQLGGFGHDVNNDIQAGMRGSVALNPPVNGARSNMNAYVLDGAYDADRNEFTAAVIPPLEAVSEFRAQTSLTPVDETQTGGGLIDIVTKSGSRAFHGSAFDYVRNQFTDANSYFVDPALGAPIYRRNQYGASLGGPLPRSTFFFATYEGLRDYITVPSPQLVPDLKQRAGNFGSEPIYDPLSAGTAAQRTEFPGNTIPASRLDPIAVKYLARWEPLPNRNSASTNYLDSTPTKQHHDSASLRVDHQFASAGLLFARYTINDDRNQVGGTFPVLAANESLRAQQMVLGHTLASARWVNDLRLSFTRLRLFDLPKTALRDNVEADLGIANPPTDPFAFGVPYFVLPDFSSVTDDPTLPQTQRDNTWNLEEGLAFERGKHTLRLGGDWIGFQFNYRNSETSRGQYTYTGGYTGNGSNPGEPLADFLLGFPTITTRTVGATQAYMREHSLAGYVRDIWRVTDALTVNLGLRYEYNSPYSEANHAMLNLDYSSLPSQPKLVRVSDSFHPNYRDFAPNIALAYRLPGWLSPHGQTVFRAGYGIYYSPEIAIENYDLILNGITNQTNTADASTRPTLTTQNGFPAGGDSGFPTLYGLDFCAPTPYVQQWNAGFQRELPSGILLEVSYVGSKGTHLGLFRHFNTPLHTETGEDLSPRPGDLQSLRTFPDLGVILQRQHIANSSYNSLQIKVEKRLVRNLSLLASYVWSKSIDDAASVLPSVFDSAGATNENNLRSGRGLSFFNVPRRLSAGFTWNLPGTPVARWLTSHWQLDGIVTLQDGTPLDPVYFATDFSNTGTTNRPNIVPGQNISLPASQRTPDHWFNTAAFSAPAPYTFGNAGRDTIPGPGNEVIDGAIKRSFPITEQASISFRAEVFNAFNHPNFGVPGPFVDFGPVFGKILSTGQPRRMQFAARFDF